MAASLELLPVCDAGNASGLIWLVTFEATQDLTIGWIPRGKQ
jgi:hypothetical protein